MNGVLVIDKPSGMTSHDVVKRVRHALQERSVGHLGTLDPMATGVLPLVLGKLTRLAQFYNDAGKSYQGQIRFGFATDTYDAEGEAAGAAQEVKVTLEEVREAAARFRGEIEQMPPAFSAKKVQGVPAYKLARKKQEVTLEPVRVEIKEFEILNLDGEVASFRARVSSGTYMRAVAHEMGQQLGVGAHLLQLRRTAVGEFTEAECCTLEQLEEAAKGDELEKLMIHPRRILPAFPCVTADELNANRICHGQAVNLPELSRARLVKVFAGQAELIAIASRVAGTLFHPKIVLVSTS
ncbi:MAG: tRNA pseudouridine(55) synthase TruB [Terriglobales bacterium]